jgi:hypothetical protein
VIPRAFQYDATYNFKHKIDKWGNFDESLRRFVAIGK